MGAFNILHTTIKCINCGNDFKGKVQFKFGNTWQFNYQVGDTVRWGGNDVGESDKPIVEVYGIAENSICPNCGYVNDEEFDIAIIDNIIQPPLKLKDITRYNFDVDRPFYVP